MNHNARETEAAIVIMAKVPQAGAVKTRLQPFLTAEQSASLYACFLQDTVSNAGQIASNVIVAYAPSNGREAIESILPDNVVFVAQRGMDLTERLEAAIEDAAKRKFNPIIVIGADSPTLTREFLQSATGAFQTNNAADEAEKIVLGATRDGGFYLVGLRKNHAHLFDNVAWSSPYVFEQVMRNIESLGLHIFRLDDWYDVDTPEDLLFLRNEMLKNERARAAAPKTYQWIQANSNLFVR